MKIVCQSYLLPFGVESSRVSDMKRYQSGIWLGLCAAVTVFEVTAISTPVNAQDIEADVDLVSRVLSVAIL